MAGYLQAILADRPVAFWPLDDAAGTMRDAAGGVGVLSVAGGTIVYANPIGPTRATSTQSGWMTGGTMPATASGYTIEIWALSLATGQSNVGVFGGWNTNNGAMIYQAGGGTPGQIQCFHQGVNVLSANQISTTEKNTMQYLVMSWDGATMTVYMDLVSQGSVASGVAPTWNTTYLGAYPGNTGTRFNGWLAWGAIYNYPLSAAAMKRHYLVGRGQGFGQGLWVPRRTRLRAA